MTAGFYARAGATNLDGTFIWKTPADEAGEREVADLVEAAWRCHLVAFGRLAPIDWWAERDGRLVGVAELKTRSHPADRFPTVYLNVRKWLALSLAAVGLGVPAIFIVRFDDGVRWLRVDGLTGLGVTIGGATSARRRVPSRGDVEPILEVPIELMEALA